MIKNFFDNVEELCEYMVDKVQDGIYSVAVLYYNDAIKLIREMMMYDDIEVKALEIKPYEYDGYDKEYYVSLADDMVASVEPAFVGGKYLNAEADLTLIDGNANSAILKYLQKDKCHEIYIGEYSDTHNYYCEKYDTCEYELLDKILENAELIKDSNDDIEGIKLDIRSLFNLFG